mmetsp:Transcript_348/g.238  ORF Transcript_348/g.238 Transcript_348/m.238 type:complete len:240 (+) Transcript_348:43-762(+)
MARQPVAVHRRSTHAVGLRPVPRVRNAAHLDRNSLKVEAGEGDAAPRLVFTLDAMEPFQASASLEAGGKQSSVGQVALPASLQQQCRLPLPAGAAAAARGSPAPVLIVELQPLEDGEVLSEATYASLQMCGSSYTVEVLRQEVCLRSDRIIGHARSSPPPALVVQDIFGLSGGSAEADLLAEPCAVCLGAPRNTVVLPCRHCCICEECAARMRTSGSKCPICRQAATQLLQLQEEDLTI